MTLGTLVDSNVLLDIMTEDPVWGEWSITALAENAETGPLYINPIIYSEVSVRFSTIELSRTPSPDRTTGANQSRGRRRSLPARHS